MAETQVCQEVHLVDVPILSRQEAIWAIPYPETTALLPTATAWLEETTLRILIMPMHVQEIHKEV